MPQTCTVCRHKKLSDINLALVSGEPLRSIAGRMGLAKSSLQRHKENCIPRDLIQARLFGKIADADMLLGQLCSLQQVRSKFSLTLSKQGITGWPWPPCVSSAVFWNFRINSR